MSVFTSALPDSPPIPRRAFLTDDCEVILRFAAEGVEYNRGSALVTLVEISGGAARAIGAQMAVHGDGAFCGFVSGGCTEAAVAAEAVEAIARGTDRYLRLGEGSRFFDIALPCGGGIQLAIHVLRNTLVVRDVLANLAQRRRVSLRYDPTKQNLDTDAKPVPSGWDDGIFVRTYRPKVRLLLCGRGIELLTTARVAAAAGFETEIYDSEQVLKTHLGEIDADTAVALLYHDIDLERTVLQAALAASPFYIGALGSGRTHARRCEALWALGHTREDTDRIRAPIGLFPKARDAGSLALSILSEIAAIRSNST